VALVRKQTIPTERPPLVSKYQPLRIEGAPWSVRWFPMAVNLNFLNPEPLVLPSPSIILKRLSGPRSRPTMKKSGKSGNWTRISGYDNQKLWSPVHRDNLTIYNTNISYYNNLAVLKTVSVVLNPPQDGTRQIIPRSSLCNTLH
jgi:hypothetical protein